MGRHVRPDHAARRLQHRRQPRHGERRQGEAHSLLRHRRRGRFPHRQGLQPLYDPLRLRHDRARQRHRQDHPRGRRQELVLPHRRLRFRHTARKHRLEPRQGERRDRDRRRARAARHLRLLVLSPAGAGVGRAGARARQRRRRHGELDEGRLRIRLDQDRCGPRRFSSSSPTSTPWASRSRRASC